MLEGQFDFNKTPIAPPGTKVMLHDKPVQRKSWNPMDLKAGTWGLPWSIIAATGYIQTKQDPKGLWTRCISPQKTTVLYQSPTDVVVQAIETIQQVCKNPTPSTPFTHVNHNQLDAIKKLAELFQQPKNDAIGTSPRVLTTATQALK